MKFIFRELSLAVYLSHIPYSTELNSLSSQQVEARNMTSLSTSNDTAVAPPTAQCAAFIGGHHTEVTRVVYSDSEFWIVTQVGKIGNVVRCAKKIAVTGQETVICETLFGKRDDPICDLFARVMAEKILSSTMKPVTLGFALKISEKTEDCMNELREVVTLASSLL